MGELGFSPEIRQWIASRVADGAYADEEDYVLDLIRRDMQAAEEDIAWVRERIAEGEASGYLEDDAKTVLRRIMAKLPHD